jgi:hypothetical protein
MANSTPKGGKVVDPTPYDLAVISVIETLDGNNHLLQTGYKKFKNKGELLEWLGIRRDSWGDIQNHRRHVPTRGKATKEMIIDKLVRHFEVNRDFLLHNAGPMFKRNILVAEAEVIYKTRQNLEEECEKLAAENKQLKRRVRELEKLSEQQAQLLDAKKVRQKVRQKR